MDRSTPLKIILVKAPQFAGYTRPQHKTFATTHTYRHKTTRTHTDHAHTYTHTHGQTDRHTHTAHTDVTYLHDSDVRLLEIGPDGEDHQGPPLRHVGHDEEHEDARRAGVRARVAVPALREALRKKP